MSIAENLIAQFNNDPDPAYRHLVMETEIYSQAIVIIKDKELYSNTLEFKDGSKLVHNWLDRTYTIT